VLASPQSKVADLAGIKSKPQGKPDFDRLRINIACLNSLDLSWHGSHVQAPALVHQRLLTSSSIPRGFCWKLWLHGASNRCCQDAAGPKRHSACPAAKNSTGLLDKVGVQAVPPPTRLKPMNYLSYLNLSEPLTRGHGLDFLKPMLNLHENCVLHLGIVTPFLITIPVRENSEVVIIYPEKWQLRMNGMNGMNVFFHVFWHPTCFLMMDMYPQIDMMDHMARICQ